jgi:hypothetical protein
VLIGLIALTIGSFGVGATGRPAAGGAHAQRRVRQPRGAQERLRHGGDRRRGDRRRHDRGRRHRHPAAAGDQYVADVLPARMFRNGFRRRGLAPQVLSRAVEDSGTVTSPLVPWNTCGAYMSGVLGVQTAAYLPFCFFNLLSPLLDVLYGFLGFKVQSLEPVETSVERGVDTPMVGAHTPLPRTGAGT